MTNLRIAIIDSDTLQAMGLKTLISEIIPIAEVSLYPCFSAMADDAGEGFMHYFITAQTLIENSPFFLEHRHMTMVLTKQGTSSPLLDNFHTLDISKSERQLVKDILTLYEKGHGHGGRQPESASTDSALSPREREVLALVVRGHINKEVADILNISLPTVVTHRKNIGDKLGMKSVSALTIYAVTHGLVTIDEI